jgi:hypothetical protein
MGGHVLHALRDKGVLSGSLCKPMQATSGRLVFEGDLLAQASDFALLALLWIGIMFLFGHGFLSNLFFVLSGSFSLRLVQD